MLTCKICGVDYSHRTSIPANHIKNQHDMTILDYNHIYGMNSHIHPEYVDDIHPDDRVICMECDSNGKYFYFKNMIPTKHFLWHGITAKQYKNKHNVKHVASDNYRNKKLGKTFSMEHKRNISTAKKKYFEDGGTTWNNGKTMNDDFKRKCSERQKRLYENNPEEVWRRQQKGIETRKRNPQNLWGFENARTTEEHLSKMWCAGHQAAKDKRIERTYKLKRDIELLNHEVIRIDEYSNGKVLYKCHCSREVEVNRYRFEKNTSFPVIPYDDGSCNLCTISYMSQPEKDISDYLFETYSNYEILIGNREILHPKELDVYIPKLKFGVEYNGLYWHSTDKGKDKNYHLEKTNRCNELGILLVHIFEDIYTFYPNSIMKYLKNITHDYGNDAILIDHTSNRGIELIDIISLQAIRHIIKHPYYSTITVNGVDVGVIAYNDEFQMICLSIEYSHQSLVSEILKLGGKYFLDKGWFNTSIYKISHRKDPLLWSVVTSR